MGVQVYPPNNTQTYVVKAADETRAGGVAVDTAMQLSVKAGTTYLLNGFIATNGSSTRGTVASSVVTGGVWHGAKGGWGLTANFGVDQEFYERSLGYPLNTPISATFTATADGVVGFNWGMGTLKKGSWLSLQVV